MQETLPSRLADRLKGLRVERGLSLDRLAELSGVSRATLSRLENSEVSPTAEVLGRLCAAYGMTVSRLMGLVEAAFAPLVPRDRQEVWRDADGDLVRRIVSPPTRALAAEVVEVEIGPAQEIDYPLPPVAGLEHHLLLLEGALEVEIDGTVHRLEPGDCLRYRLFGASAFRTPADRSARYLLVLVEA